MTEEEIRQAKSVLKDKVKDQSQALLDEARNSVDDKVRVYCCYLLLCGCACVLLFVVCCCRCC